MWAQVDQTLVGIMVRYITYADKCTRGWVAFAHAQTEAHSDAHVHPHGGLTKHKALGVLGEQVCRHCWGSIRGRRRLRSGHSCNSSRRLNCHAGTGGHAAWRCLRRGKHVLWMVVVVATVAYMQC